MSHAEPGGHAIVAQGALPNLRGIQGLLERQGIESQLVQAPKENQSG